MSPDPYPATDNGDGTSSMRNGDFERLRREDLDALSFWMIYFGAVRDDRIRIEVTDPDGKPFVQQEFAQGENRARQFYFAGKKATGEALKRGTYTGKATVVHKGAEVRKDEIVKTVTLE